MTDRALADAAYPPGPPPRPERTREARAALLAAARAEGARPRGPRPWRRWPQLAALGLVAVAVAAVTLVPLRLAGPATPARADAATVRTLEGTARVAERRPPVPAPGPGQYLYTRSRGTYLNGSEGFLYLADVRRQSWIGADGALHLRQRSLRPRFVTARDRAAWVAAGRPRLIVPGGPGITTIPASGPRRAWADVLPDAELVRLAGDPQGLAARIREVAEGHGPSLEEEMFTVVGDLLRESTVPPVGRAGVYRAAAYLPGVRLTGRVLDPARRPGMALTQERGGLRRELIFDPGTAMLLAEREVIASEESPYGRHYPPGTTVSATAHLAQRLVSAPGATREAGPEGAG